MIDYAFCSFDGTDEEAEEHLKMIIGLELSWLLHREVQKDVFFTMEVHFINSLRHHWKK